MIPALIARRLEGETPNSFIERQDRLRNAAHTQGFGSPTEHGGNLFDETNAAEEVFERPSKWPITMAYEFADIAGTRDELADRIMALIKAGVGIISVNENIDLRGLDARSQGALDMCMIFCRLEATNPEPETEQEEPETNDRPKTMTDEAEALVRAHLAEHGTEKVRELMRGLGQKSPGTAGRWLKWAAEHPVAETEAPTE